MKVYEDGKYVKMIPSRYKPIQGSVLDLVETDKKRLSPAERKFLEICLLRHDLKENDKFVFELIQGADFTCVIKVIRPNDIEYRAVFNDSMQVRITLGSALILNGGEFIRTTKIA